MPWLFAQESTATYPGINGFIPGSRGSIMLDVVFAAMFAIVPALGYSLWQVKQRRFERHRQLQLLLGMILLLAVTAFEVDMRFFTDWAKRAEPSPYFDKDHKWTCPAGVSLIVHLCFAVPTAVLWAVVIVRAVRNFPQPTKPGHHSQSHRRWAKLASVGMLLTAVTGWIFYWLAFVK